MNFKDDKIYSSTETNLEYFVGEMNILAQYLKLENTKFSNPHGLSDKQNKSTSNDLAYLCYYSMKNPDFRKIVRTTSYKCETYNTNMRLKR
jgi:D-alanyl-D-alanine carboxypeptidase (penicillin-binding protein 5/6)